MSMVPVFQWRTRNLGVLAGLLGRGAKSKIWGSWGVPPNFAHRARGACIALQHRLFALRSIGLGPVGLEVDHGEKEADEEA